LSQVVHYLKSEGLLSCTSIDPRDMVVALPSTTAYLELVGANKLKSVINQRSCYQNRSIAALPSSSLRMVCRYAQITSTRAHRDWHPAGWMPPMNPALASGYPERASGQVWQPGPDRAFQASCTRREPASTNEMAMPSTGRAAQSRRLTTSSGAAESA
jgi:hypothetical protein